MGKETPLQGGGDCPFIAFFWSEGDTLFGDRHSKPEIRAEIAGNRSYRVEILLQQAWAGNSPGWEPYVLSPERVAEFAGF
jgi:hypothetical protein